MQRAHARIASAVAVASALATVTPAAPAAEPSGGAVSFASPSVTWTGESSYGFLTTFSQIVINLTGEKQPCQAPSCDTFLLEVKDVGDLQVEVTADSSITYLQIEKPDGSVVYNEGVEIEGEEPDPVTRLRIKRAPTGTYKVEAAVNDVYPAAIEGRATLIAPPAPVVAPPAPAAAPEPAPAASVFTRVGRLSARRLARTRRLPLTLHATAPLTSVRLALTARRRTVATGRLARLEGTRKHALRLKRKLKPGRYRLTVSGRDGTGRTVRASDPIAIRR